MLFLTLINTMQSLNVKKLKTSQGNKKMIDIAMKYPLKTPNLKSKLAKELNCRIFNLYVTVSPESYCSKL